MNLKLRISSKKVANRGQNKTYLFAVVDLDKAPTYPQNFVCLLPRITPTIKSQCTFQKTYGDQSLQIAKTLLTKALRSEDDHNVKEEIQKRLTALNPKSTATAQCTRCGSTFHPKTFIQLQQKICHACRNKFVKK